MKSVHDTHGCWLCTLFCTLSTTFRWRVRTSRTRQQQPRNRLGPDHCDGQDQATRLRPLNLSVSRRAKTLINHSSSEYKSLMVEPNADFGVDFSPLPNFIISIFPPSAYNFNSSNNLALSSWPKSPYPIPTQTHVPRAPCSLSFLISCYKRLPLFHFIISLVLFFLKLLTRSFSSCFPSPHLTSSFLLSWTTRSHLLSLPKPSLS